MHTVTQWKAKRAGGRMTVYGKDESGADIKIVGVDYIERFQSDNGTGRVTVAVIDHVSPTKTWRLAD